MHVLVTDDERSVRSSIRRALTLEGYRVSEAEDGAQALAAIAREAPDAVVLDVMMPELDGWAVLKALRAQPRYERLPVLMLTAAATSQDVERSYSLGASAVMGKPYDGDRLAHMVETLLVQADVLN